MNLDRRGSKVSRVYLGRRLRLASNAECVLHLETKSMWLYKNVSFGTRERVCGDRQGDRYQQTDTTIERERGIKRERERIHES